MATTLKTCTTWVNSDAVIANLNANGMDAVADVVYNHRDGGLAEDNPAVKDYVETHFDGNGKQPFPSDRYRLRLPLGATYGAGEYFFKISSKTESYGANIYKFYATVESQNNPYLGAVNENEPNGGGDCGQPFDEVQLDQDMVATLFDFSGCYTDEFKLLRPPDIRRVLPAGGRVSRFQHQPRGPPVPNLYGLHQPAQRAGRDEL